MLSRVQLRHCVPKARRQPKHLCSPRRSTATEVALLALRSSRPSSLANAGHREASFGPLPLMRLTHPGQEHGSQGMPALLKCSDSSSQAQPSGTSSVSEMMSLQGGPYKTPPPSFLHSWANNGQDPKCRRPPCQSAALCLKQSRPSDESLRIPSLVRGPGTLGWGWEQLLSHTPHTDCWLQ